MTRQKIVTILAGLILSFWTIRCGSGGKSSDIHFSIAPGTPAVITTDYKLNDSQTVTAPWYAFRVTITNGSDETLSILNLTLNVTLIDSTGNQSTGTIAINPSAANFTLVCGTDTSVQIEYNDFGEWAPGESKQVSLTYHGTLPGTCPTVNTTFPILYAGGNPQSTDPNNPAYNYIVELVPNGWFGTLANPQERLQASYYFSTN